MPRLLIVEDDPDTVELARDLFSGPAYEVETTPNGVEALQRVAARAFDLILLDVDVDDLGGLAVQRAVRDFSDVPTIVLSARTGPWTAEALRAGATACMAKPFSAVGLLRLAETILQSEPPGRKGWPRDVRSLGPADLRRLARMPRRRLDALPFGVIRLDERGRITAFNAYEAAAAREASETVLGKSFAGLAPCTRVKSFMQVLGKARSGRPVDEVLRFVFPRHGALALVSVRIYAPSKDAVWLFVSQRRSPGREPD